MASYSRLRAENGHPYEVPYEKEGYSCLCRSFSSLVVIFILVAILDQFTNLILRPSYPSVFVTSATISSFKLYHIHETYSHTLKFEYIGHLASAFNVSFSVQNSNMHAGVAYDDICTSIRYRYGLIQGWGKLPAFKQEKGGRTNVLLTKEDDRDLLPGLFGEITKGLKDSNGILEFKVRFEAIIRFSQLMWLSRKMMTSCGVKIMFSSDREQMEKGAMVGAPTSCDVRLSKI